MTLHWRARMLTADDLATVRATPAQAAGAVAGGEAGDRLDLGRLWHGVKWVIESSEIAQGAEDGILGGSEVLKNESGTWRAFEPDAVAEIATALQGATVDDFAAGFLEDEMMDEPVYPAIWDEEGVLEDQLFPAFTAYQDFFAKAAAAGDAVLTYLD